MKRLVILNILFLIISNSFSQDIDSAMKYFNAGNYNEAAIEFEKIIPLIENDLGSNDTTYLTYYLVHTAVSYSKSFQLDKAIYYYLKIISIYEGHNYKNAPFYFVSLNNLAELYRTTGLFDQAELYIKKAIEVKKEFLGVTHPMYATSINNLALLYQNIGMYDKALKLCYQASQIRKQSLGENNPTYAASLNNLATAYQYLGNFKEAEQLHLKALKILKNSIGEYNDDYATSLNNLALLYHSIGIYDIAKSMYFQALEIRKEILGINHPNFNATLSNLANLYQVLGDYQNAEIIYLQVIENIRNIYGKEHPYYTTTLNNLGLLYIKVRKYKSSEKFFLEALEIMNTIYPEKHLMQALSLGNLAMLYQETFRYEKSVEYYLKALKIRENILGKGNSINFNLFINLALVYQAIGNVEKAQSLYNSVLEIALKQIDIQFRYLSNTEKEKYLLGFVNYYHIYSSFHLLNNEKKVNASEDLYNIELASKGLILSSSSRLKNEIYLSKDYELINLYDKWLMNKSIIAKQYSKPIKDRTEDLSKIETQTDELEKMITRKSSDLLIRLDNKKITWKDIEQKLNQNDAAIEFSSFRLHNGKNWTDSVIYVAYLIRKDYQNPIQIELFEEKKLDSLLKTAVGNKTTSIYRGVHISLINKRHDNILYDLIWKSIEPYLQGVDQIYYSPSGLLNQISFAAIQINDSVLLSDKYELSLLLSTSLLVEKNEEQFSKPKTITLFGGIDYAMGFDKMRKNSEKQIKYIDTKPVLQHLIDMDFERGGSWNFLSGTMKEIQLIDNIAQKNKIESKTILGTEAVEESFKRLSRKSSPNVIHIATHGFFFPNPTKDYSKGSNIDEISSASVFKISDNPLMRSGLLFAGANNFWMGGQVPENMEDGILTSYEVSNLYLPNTKLVVLSACETGLGDIKGNEGVYGLQRAFKMAGVEYIIMSLWKVPDAETVEFMKFFYDKWFSGIMIEDAFRSAQKSMKTKYPNQPYKWAAFVLIR